MQKHKGKYRNESHRLKGWNYARNGLYFNTFNTYDRACLFGDIFYGKMIVNDFGKIATEEWFRSFEMRDELFLDEFILIPNHLHAGIRITDLASIKVTLSILIIILLQSLLNGF